MKTIRDRSKPPKEKEEVKSDLALIRLLVAKPGLTEEEARRELNFPQVVGELPDAFVGAFSDTF